MVEEDKRNKLPTNYDARKRRADWIVNDETARKEAEEKVSGETHLLRALNLFILLIFLSLLFRVSITIE